MVSDAQIAKRLDCQGFVCPYPIVELARAIKAVEKGAIVEMLATDPGSVRDVEAFQKRTGHQLVEHSQADGVFRFLVRRAK